MKRLLTTLLIAASAMLMGACSTTAEYTAYAQAHAQSQNATALGQSTNATMQGIAGLIQAPTSTVTTTTSTPASVVITPVIPAPVITPVITPVVVPQTVVQVPAK